MLPCQHLAHYISMNRTATRTRFRIKTALQKMSPEVTVSMIFGVIMFILAVLSLWQGWRRRALRSKGFHNSHGYCFTDFRCR